MLPKASEVHREDGKDDCKQRPCKDALPLAVQTPTMFSFIFLVAEPVRRDAHVLGSRRPSSACAASFRKQIRRKV